MLASLSVFSSTQIKAPEGSFLISSIHGINSPLAPVRNVLDVAEHLRSYPPIRSKHFLHTIQFTHLLTTCWLHTIMDRRVFPISISVAADTMSTAIYSLNVLHIQLFLRSHIPLFFIKEFIQTSGRSISKFTLKTT